ncbi:VanZ family protein [Pelomonas sp. SE-A7]|uniref:VanZ family protein n=1 Tax=Pelomonas sp. SE-A7 TaxID=3054953 RepID=UPI00259CC124|nr:VanZ family protein [Pelomonas sp. SE-A7]MDM4767989.1 VanZ family protein [Pelomonas sp. SE-A7]
MQEPGRRRSSATWLALIYGLLVVHASLYPFGPWTWPTGVTPSWLIGLPWPRYWGPFDVWVNVLGYLPMGLLTFAAVVRSGGSRRAGLLLAIAGLSALSYLMESLQYFLPSRAPSLADWLLNSLGALLGGLLGGLLHHFGGLQRWHGWRERWFLQPSEGALALLALWPVGLLFPAPLPLGLGQLLPRLRELSESLLAGTPWEIVSGAEPVVRPLPPGLEAIAIALGLLGPALLALSAARPGWRRVFLVLGALLLGVVGTTWSTVLNFGPQHAWAWLTPATWPGLGLGAALAWLACLLSRRAAAAWGLVVLTALIALVSEAPADPYLAQSLQFWEQGRFINLYGLAQWIGWTWPFAALAWLLWRVAQRDPTR